MMSEIEEKRHEYRGMSSKGFLDANKVLGVIGIKEGDIFLDLGSGEGYFSIAGSKAVGKSGTVYAYDIDEAAITRLRKEMAEKNSTNIIPSVVDITKELPLSDDTISLAFISNVLHGLVANGEADDTLNEISRVNVRSGRLAIVEFKKQESPHGPPLSIRLSSDEVEPLVRRYGFLTERVKEVGPYHYAIIFKKR